MLLLSIGLVAPAQRQGLGVSRYLPPGASVQDDGKYVRFAALSGEGEKYVVVFYRLGDQANILVLRPGSTGYTPFWRDRYDGSSGFGDPTGVYDINHDGLPDIVAYRDVGASCPGVLDIYEYRHGRMATVFSRGRNCQWPEIKDLDGDGVPELIIKTRSYGVNPHIYHWNGRRYVRSDSRYARYYDASLMQLLRALRDPGSFPLTAKLMWGSQAIGIYVIQQRYAEAALLAKELLRITDRTRPADLDVTRANAKREVYRLLGDVYKAAGDIRQSKKYYKMAADSPG